ncbi:MAG: nucleoside triphosphate pyrophosphatase [Candidatus Pacearchaeota archaeon]
MKIILATSSPYRQQMFRDAGIEFQAQASEIDEKFKGRPASPSELVQTLAKLKANDVAKHYNEGIIIGFDSIGYFDGEILEKPKSEEEAFERLKRMSGNTFSFYTGIFMINKSSGKEMINVVETTAQMRKLIDEEIRRYLNSDTKYKTYALGFDPLKGLSSTFIKSINGSYLNILQGLPLETIIEMLEAIK